MAGSIVFAACLPALLVPDSRPPFKNLSIVAPGADRKLLPHSGGLSARNVFLSLSGVCFFFCSPRDLVWPATTVTWGAGCSADTEPIPSRGGWNGAHPQIKLQSSATIGVSEAQLPQTAFRLWEYISDRFCPFFFHFPVCIFFYFSPPILQSYVRSFSPFFTPVDNGNWRSVFSFFLGFVLHENEKNCPETILTLCAALAQHQPNRTDVRETAHEKGDWPFVYCLQAVRNWLLLLLQTMTDRDRVQEAIFYSPFFMLFFSLPPFFAADIEHFLTRFRLRCEEVLFVTMPAPWSEKSTRLRSWRTTGFSCQFSHGCIFFFVLPLVSWWNWLFFFTRTPFPLLIGSQWKLTPVSRDWQGLPCIREMGSRFFLLFG